MNVQDISPVKGKLISLINEVNNLLGEIGCENKLHQKANAENGKMEFAYVDYYLTEVSQLLNLTKYLLGHETLSKYIHFPARMMLEIVLQQEHVYSVRIKKGADAVKRMLFKDITIGVKSALALPGEDGRATLEKNLSMLDVAGKILKIDFKTEDISAKSNRGIKDLCNNSHIVLKNSTGIKLHDYYEILSEASHANVAEIGAGNYGDGYMIALGYAEIAVELAVRFVEMVVEESKYSQFTNEVKKMNDVMKSTFIFSK